MPQVKITLGKDGSIKAEGIDFKGSNCMEATKILDQLFGKAVKTELKDEYYQEEDGIKVIEGLPSGWCG